MESLDQLRSLPGQTPSLQGTVSVSFPTHPVPACIGAGFVQVLDRDFIPGPHETLHLSKGPQSDQSPFTGTVNK